MRASDDMAGLKNFMQHQQSKDFEGLKLFFKHHSA
jgi:hypothetical protein